MGKVGGKGETDKSFFLLPVEGTSPGCMNDVVR